MKRGLRVEVADAFVNKRVMRVDEVIGNTVYVCREDEFEVAKREKRDPISTGVSTEFILRVLDESPEKAF